MSIYPQFLQQISRYYPHQQRFLIGFSGGLDSTALLALFAKLAENQPHLQLRAIHIHHGFSPNADDWAEHCHQMCRQFNIPLIVERVTPTSENGIEAGAREARYQAIQRYLTENEVLATAHHQQDQTETFFLALKRGSGLQGLSAMQVNSCAFGVPIFRPLLPFSRAELEDYVRTENLSWIEDESNADNRYERNFLRNTALPILRRRWQHFDDAVQRTAQHCFEQQQLINELLAQDYQKIYRQSDRTLSLIDFAEYSPAKQKALLRQWLAEFGLQMPSLIQTEQIIRDVIFARSDRNPHFRFAEQQIRRYQQRLYLTPDFADLSRVILPVVPNQRLSLPDDLGEFVLEQRANGYMAKWQNHIQPLPPTTLPIQIRFAYGGKVRNPQGIRQDIKKLWQKHNVPVWLRQRIPLIFYGEHFQSAVGFFENFERVE
ncbi:tRNA lysidine(34) synthetase TilS [Caviibacterium pharyngocola]|uniref:tRNA(Ile)-lysidine synthase n=1 Tax=Caviibacterium pharyngocola TaxID=28159 RepID=A0A2M8RWP5_9PAST|nr:tRNA lysidine(34) synthetase TilS [Caviibacterium pharyngocola]PJG83308.1 tRNA lysidine(34) synthetase TilS [Caviibacterium pharyngocola]